MAGFAGSVFWVPDKKWRHETTETGKRVLRRADVGLSWLRWQTSVLPTLLCAGKRHLRAGWPAILDSSLCLDRTKSPMQDSGQPVWIPALGF